MYKITKTAKEQLQGTWLSEPCNPTAYEPNSGLRACTIMVGSTKHKAPKLSSNKTHNPGVSPVKPRL